MATKKKFNGRAFTSLFTLLSFIVMAVSGIILYACPTRMLGLPFCFLKISYEGWTNLHVIFSFTFVVLSAFHLFYNMKPLVAYIKGKLSESRVRRIELLAAILACALLLVGTLSENPVLTAILDFGASTKASLVREPQVSPIVTASQNPSPSFEAKTQEPLTISPSTPAPTAEVEKNPLEEEVDCEGEEGCGRGRAIGILTLEELCSSYEVDLEKAMKHLKSEGVNVTPQSKIRHIADEMGLLPDNILKMLMKL